MKRDQFEWDDIDDIYHKEKYGYNHMINNHRDDLEEISLMIRNDLTNKRISIIVNNYMQIVVRYNLNNIETISSISNAMEELNNIRLNYLLGILRFKKSKQYNFLNCRWQVNCRLKTSTYLLFKNTNK
jgi:hypothetical protein